MLCQSVLIVPCFCPISYICEPGNGVIIETDISFNFSLFANVIVLSMVSSVSKGNPRIKNPLLNIPASAVRAMARSTCSSFMCLSAKSRMPWSPLSIPYETCQHPALFIKPNTSLSTPCTRPLQLQLISNFSRINDSQIFINLFLKVRNVSSSKEISLIPYLLWRSIIISIIYSAEKYRNCLEKTEVSQKIHLCGQPLEVRTYVAGN